MRWHAFRKLWVHALLLVLLIGFAGLGTSCIVRSGHGHGHGHGHVHRGPRHEPPRRHKHHKPHKHKKHKKHRKHRGHH